MSFVTRRRALTGLAVTAAAVLAPPAGSAFATDASADGRPPGPRPLWRAHAHNDYEHPRPLLDALDHRFGSVEADIFLVDGALLVAHSADQLDPARTLESLYLAPLAARVRAHHGSVYRGHRQPLQLLVDIKTEGASTYLALDRQLRRYQGLFTTYAHGRARSPPSSPATGRPASPWRRRPCATPSTTDGSPTSAPPTPPSPR